MAKRKITILYVLKILKEGTDQNNPLSQAVITRAINLLGISCDRKTVARDIDVLIEFGYDIRKIKGGGCYLKNNDLSVREINNLLEGIESLNLSLEEKCKLRDKVKRL